MRAHLFSFFLDINYDPVVYLTCVKTNQTCFWCEYPVCSFDSFKAKVSVSQSALAVKTLICF